MKKLFITLIAIIICSSLFGSQYFTKYKSKLREKPESKSEVLDLIPENTYIVIVEETNIFENIDQWKEQWYKIYYKNKFGYIYGALIEVRESKNLHFTIYKDFENKSDYKYYINEELKISFSCPKNWNIKIIKGGTMHIALTVNFNNHESIFLSAVNSKGTMGGRGGYYGDEAVYIKDEKYLLDLYKKNFNTALYNNQNNIKILNYNGIEDISMMPEEETILNIFDRFFIYNPNSIYHGIIISYERLLENPYSETDKKYIEIKNQIYYLLNSLKFEN